MEGLLSVPSNKQNLDEVCACLRMYVYVWTCMQMSACDGLLGWGGWMVMSVGFKGISYRALSQFYVHMWMSLRGGRQINVERQREKYNDWETEDDVLWFTVPPPQTEATATIDVASARHSRMRMTRGWKWLQIQPDRPGSKQRPHDCMQQSC